MTEGLTAQRNSSKQTRRSTDGGSGCAAAASGGCAAGYVAAASGGSAANQAGNTKQDGSTTSPLAAALVLKDKFIVSLHIMSQPLSTSVLSKFATAYYAEAKHNETKSDQNYVSKSVKGLGFLLQGLPEVEQSEGFKALRNNFTIDLEKFRMSIMQNYVFPLNDLNVEAKRHQFHIAFCKLLRGLATIYIAQCGITGYSEDVAIADLIAIKNDTILVPVNLNTKQFLKAYVKAHGIQVFPKPSINNNLSDLIDEINGAPPVQANAEEADADANQANGVEAAPQDQVHILEEEEEGNQNDDAEMMELAANAEIIGGRSTVCRNIFDAIMRCVIEPIHTFHKQRLDNEEAKRIKTAITLPRLSDTAQRVAQVIASERPVERPVLRGLIQETANNSTSELEKRLKSLEDKLKAATLKTNKSTAKNEKGGGTKSPKSILRKKGKPAAPINQMPKKKAAAQGDNTNVIARDNKKLKPKKRRVSFDGKKDGERTNLRK
jgi:hypothetical protein